MVNVFDQLTVYCWCFVFSCLSSGHSQLSSWRIFYDIPMISIPYIYLWVTDCFCLHIIIWEDFFSFIIGIFEKHLYNRLWSDPVSLLKTRSLSCYDPVTKSLLDCSLTSCIYCHAFSLSFVRSVINILTYCFLFLILVPYSCDFYAAFLNLYYQIINKTAQVFCALRYLFHSHIQFIIFVPEGAIDIWRLFECFVESVSVHVYHYFCYF